MTSEAAVTLGILAGGRGSRLGGIDKAWLVRDGVPQVARIVRRLQGQVDAVLVSSNTDPAGYAGLAVEVVADAVPAAGAGPMAGLSALAGACATARLLTVPVDVVDLNDCLLRSLDAAGAPGAYVVDADGVQPLLALWDAERLRVAAAAAIASGELSVQRLQQALGMHAVALPLRLGNLNTHEDLAAAGVRLPGPR